MFRCVLLTLFFVTSGASLAGPFVFKVADIPDTYESSGETDEPTDQPTDQPTIALTIGCDQNGLPYYAVDASESTGTGKRNKNLVVLAPGDHIGQTLSGCSVGVSRVIVHYKSPKKANQIEVSVGAQIGGTDHIHADLLGKKSGWKFRSVTVPVSLAVDNKLWISGSVGDEGIDGTGNVKVRGVTIADGCSGKFEAEYATQHRTMFKDVYTSSGTGYVKFQKNSHTDFTFYGCEAAKYSVSVTYAQTKYEVKKQKSRQMTLLGPMSQSITMDPIVPQTGKVFITSSTVEMMFSAGENTLSIAPVGKKGVAVDYITILMV